MCSTSLLLHTIQNHATERSYENYTLEQLDETICLFKLMENAMVLGAELNIYSLRQWYRTKVSMAQGVEDENSGTASLSRLR